MQAVKKRVLGMAVAIMSGLASGQAMANVTTITFDEVTQGLVHGSVLNSQYSGISISAENLSSGPDLAVIYNTSGGNSTQYDTDLEGPAWGNNNLAQHSLDASTYQAGNAVIIQENNYQNSCDTGICARPDDEGSRPSGTVTFEFDFNITSMGFDLIDFEDVERRNSSVTFFNDAMESVTHTFSSFTGGIHNAVFGDNSINRIYLASIGLTNVNKAVFSFGGSGAVDTIKYVREPGTSTQVSEPSVLALMALALIALVRRKAR